MNIIIINCVCGIRSTGKICAELADKLVANGNNVKIAYGRDSYIPDKYKKYAIRIGSPIDVNLAALQTRLFDNHGFASKRATKSFLKWATDFNPDLVWLHNLHGYYINVKMLFTWIKMRPEMQVKWTLHDCWAFTGHCSYFTVVKCEQWKTHCSYCSQLRRYPKCYLKSNVYKNFDRKRAAFTGVKNMTLITPSKWLADLVKLSFLKEYPIEVHYNTIDTNVFRPTPSDFRYRYGLQDKIVLLGVASVWSERKGLNDFYKLAKMLDDKYVIVLVGLTEKQIKKAPNNIKGYKKTDNQNELAAIYTAADLYLNLSVEETFGMTTVEAEACGTPAIVYKGSACEEIVKLNGGEAVQANVEEIFNAINKRQDFLDRHKGNN